MKTINGDAELQRLWIAVKTCERKIFYLEDKNTRREETRFFAFMFSLIFIAGLAIGAVVHCGLQK